MRVAIIEPVRHYAEVLERVLLLGGHACECFATSASFLTQASRHDIDLLLTDNWAGDLSAQDVIAPVRLVLPDLPIAVLGQSARESEIVAALNSGADDFLDKSMGAPELLARINALIRRAGLQRGIRRRVTHFEEYAFDVSRLSVTFHGQTTVLTPKEFRFALLLFSNLGRNVPRARVLELAWMQTRDLRTRTIDTHASRLRTKLNLRPEHGYRLTALYGYGFRLERLPQRSAEAG